MRWCLPRKLNDELAQVSLDSFNALLLENMCELDFFGDHGFRLQNERGIVSASQVENVVACMLFVLGPVHHHPIRCCVSLKLLKKLGKVANRVFLDPVSGLPKGFPVQHLTHHTVPSFHSMVRRSPEPLSSSDVLAFLCCLGFEFFGCYVHFRATGKKSMWQFPCTRTRRGAKFLPANDFAVRTLQFA